MPYRHLITFACLALLVTAAGCIDYKETITIENAAGAGRIDIEARIPAALRLNTDRLGIYAPLVASEETAREYLAGRQLSLATYSVSEDAEYVNIRATVRFKNITQCNAEGNVDTFNLQSTPEGRLTLSRGISANKEPLQLQAQERREASTLHLTFKMVLPRKVDKAAFAGLTFTTTEGNAASWDITGMYYADIPGGLSLNATCTVPPKKKSGILFTALMVVLVVLMTMGGYSCRLFGAVGTLIALCIANVITMNVFEPVADLLGGISKDFNEYANALAYILVFFGSFLTIQLALLSRMREWLNFHPNLDRAASIGIGFINGLVLAGVISTFYFLLPFTYDFIGGTLGPEDPPPASVRVFRHAANHFGGSRRFDPVGQFPYEYTD
ncbi:MAG: CvpA family protein [Pseudomonadota bacterium]